jgi:5,10-methylenetetrahydromethanopterin reductase
VTNAPRAAGDRPPAARPTLRTGIWFFPDAESRRTVALARRAEAAGLDEFWLGDEGPARDPFALLSAAAIVTERVLLGIGVTNPYLRHPASTAVAAMTLHELSGGRALLGIGPGGGIALNPVGIVRERPLARAREAVRIVRAVAAGHATDGFTPPPRPFTAPDLPIWIGARGEGFNRFASEAADGAFVAGIPLPLYETAVGWARSVRRIDVAIYPGAIFNPAEVESIRPRLVFALLDAPEINRERLGLHVEDVRRAASAYASGDSGPARSLITDPILDQLVFRGTPDQVGRSLADLVLRTGADSVGLALLTPDLERGVDDAAAALATARSVVAASIGADAASPSVLSATSASSALSGPASSLSRRAPAAPLAEVPG